MTEREQLEQAIAAMEAQRPLVGDGVADAAVAAFRDRLETLVTAGGRRFVTVLCGEACGPASVGEASQPVERLWKRLEVIIARFGGVVERREGDRFWAVFRSEEPADGGDGASSDGPADASHAIRCLRAALELLGETQRFGAAESPAGLQMRAGASSGAVLANPPGAGREYIPVGDTESVAARLRESAQAGEILISPSTFRAVRGVFDIQSLEPQPVKPGAELTPVYRVRGLRPRALRLGPQGIGVPVMVGRETELAGLEAAFEEVVRERVLRMVTVVGEAGAGKTRLVHELLRRFDAQERSFVLFRGRADPALNFLPHALLRDLLAFRFKILDSDSQAVAKARLIRGIEDWLGAGGEEAAHWIGQWAGFDFTSSPYLSGLLDETLRAKSTALASVRRFLSAVANHTPLLIVVDDLHWADDGSLDGIEALARSGISAPALMITLARPSLWQRRPGWGKHSAGHQRIELAPLSHTVSTVLASQALRTALVGLERTTSELITLPARLVDRIVENGAGNPLFIEELVQGYLEHGVLISALHRVYGPGSETGWRVDMTRLAALRPPANLEEAVQSHLDGLPANERAVLRRAAVIGQVFWDEAVRSLLEPDEEADSLDLPAVLLALQARGLILHNENSAFENTEEYAFRSASLHEIVAQNIPTEQLCRDHRRAAEWLATYSGERCETYAAVIARHYDQAGDCLLAGEWYQRAAMQARLISAPEASVRFFNRALEILPDDDPASFPLRAAHYAGLWDVQWWLCHYEEALETGRRMLAAATSAEDEATQAAAWNRIASVYSRLGDHTSALRSNQNAERTARRAGATGEVVKALFNRGMTLFSIGNEAGALEAGEQALAFTQAMLSGGSDREAARESARILSLLGMIHQRSGRYGQAGQEFRDVLEVYRGQADRPGMISALNNLGENASLEGDYRQAAGYYQAAGDLARQLDYNDLESISLSGLAGAQVELGEYRQAEEQIREVLRRVQGRDWLPMAEVYRNLACACLGEEKLMEAFESGQQALRLAAEAKNPQQVGRAWRVLGRIAAGWSADLDAARPQIVWGKPFDPHVCYAASLQVFVEQGQAAEQARTIREWALYELESGDRREGVRMWKEAREVFARLGLNVEVERMDRKPVTRTGSLSSNQ